MLRELQAQIEPITYTNRDAGCKPLRQNTSYNSVALKKNLSCWKRSILNGMTGDQAWLLHGSRASFRV